MLYNKDWDKPKVKADPFSLESLIAWLEKMPANGVYCYAMNGECLIAQYLTGMGFECVSIGPDTYRHAPDRDTRHPLPSGWDDIAANGNRTFGAALARALARKILSKD